MEKYPLLKLKAELLCLGVKLSDDLLTKVDNYFLERNFIHGSQLILNGNVTVNVAVNEKYVLKFSPFELSKIKNEWFILKNGLPVTTCKPLLMPQWANLPLNRQAKVGDIVRPHNEYTLFCVPIKKCIFEVLNKKCKFCTFVDHNRISKSDNLNLVKKAFEIIFSQTDQYKAVAIGGATPNLDDFGASYYSEVVKIIKKIKPEIKISLEIIPPMKLDMLNELYSAGVDSIIMNLEIFDDNIRQYICPGKSVIPKSHYFKAYERALNIFGKNRVSSVLIVGLEDRKSTIEGAKKLIRMGVTPTLMPFRPYDACELNFLPPVEPRYYLSVYEQILEDIIANRIDPREDYGCTYCGGCSLEKLLVIKNKSNRV